MATIKAAEIWNPNTQYSGGSCGVVLPCAATQELIDRLTSEWESYTDGREIRAIAIDLPEGWRLVETRMGEGALETGEGEIILSRELFITGEGEITVCAGHGGRPRNYCMKFRAWEG